MEVVLRELELEENSDIWEMFDEIDAEENGFINSAHKIPLCERTDWLKKKKNDSNGQGMLKDHVPQTIYFLYIDNCLAGYGKLRHCLNEALRERGGHIGYVIRPSARGKGYGYILLKELLKKAEEKGISDVLLTCNPKNKLSQKVIVKNNGILDAASNEKVMKFWIKL